MDTVPTKKNTFNTIQQDTLLTCHLQPSLSLPYVKSTGKAAMHRLCGVRDF